jgi:hypothetical protein
LYFSYIGSVILLSLAIYGGWLLIRDIWDMFIEPRLVQLPSASFLIIVKDCEQEIEDLMRYLVREIENNDSDCDIVVVDNNSSDLTPVILARIADDNPIIEIIRVTNGAKPVAEGLPLCRGGVVHVLEIGRRLSADEFMLTVCKLLEQDKREVAVVRHD